MKKTPTKQTKNPLHRVFFNYTAFHELDTKQINQGDCISVEADFSVDHRLKYIFKRKLKPQITTCLKSAVDIIEFQV